MSSIVDIFNIVQYHKNNNINISCDKESLSFADIKTFCETSYSVRPTKDSMETEPNMLSQQSTPEEFTPRATSTDVHHHMCWCISDTDPMIMCGRSFVQLSLSDACVLVLLYYITGEQSSLLLLPWVCTRTSHL